MLHSSNGGGSRSRPDEKPRRQPPSPAAAPRRRGRVKSTLETPVVSCVEESSFTFEFRRGSEKGKEKPGEGLYKKPKATPANMPRGKGVAKELELVHCSPGIVARLMGLETVPRPKKVCEEGQIDEGGIREADAPSEDQICLSSTEELPELKDVFEVTEMGNRTADGILKVGSEEMSCKDYQADLDFVKQKFMDIKRLSADEACRNSKEFSEALEILYSKSDLFLEILQEESSMLFGVPGDLHGYNGLQLYPHTSNIAIAKLFEDNNLHNNQEVEQGIIAHSLKEVEGSEDPLSSLYLKEADVFLPIESQETETESNGNVSRRCSKIVILKPNIRKARSLEHVPSSQETSQFDRKSYGKSIKPPNRSMYVEDSMQPTCKRSSRRKVSEAECSFTIGTERANTPSISHDNCNRLRLASVHSTGSSVIRKAQKHLSERWQINCQSDRQGPITSDPRTLGEMLALSDKDTAKATSHKRASVQKNQDDVRQIQDSPLGIRSKDGWKKGIHCRDDSRDGTLRNFSRSKSVPAPSTNGANLPHRRRSALAGDLPILKDILNTPSDDSANGQIRKRSPIRKAKQKNERDMIRVGKENMLPEKEIHVNSELRHSICISDLSRASPVYNEHCDDAINIEDDQASDSVAPYCRDEEQTSKSQKGQIEQKLASSFTTTDENTSAQNQDKMVEVDCNNIVIKEESNQSAEINIVEFNSQTIQSAYTMSSENCECSSPTVSLQQPAGEELPYSGIFKSINAGIQELRVQLQMLKTDQANTYVDDLDPLSSDECNDMDISTHQLTEEMPPKFKDEEERDFSYVQDMLAGVCDLPLDPEDRQVGSNVFLELENKYSRLLLWSKSDRNLLFDLVNSTLADVTAPSSSLHSKMLNRCWPKLDQGLLVENVWHTMITQSNGLHCTWDSASASLLDHHSEFEAIRKEIVEMINEDILEECVAFMSQKFDDTASNLMHTLVQHNILNVCDDHTNYCAV